MKRHKKIYRSATALDVKNGDIILTGGYRARAGNVKHYKPEDFGMRPQFDGEVFARYTLESWPGDGYEGLPVGFGGGTYGGNQLASVAILDEGGSLPDKFSREMREAGCDGDFVSNSFLSR